MSDTLLALIQVGHAAPLIKLPLGHPLNNILFDLLLPMMLILPLGLDPLIPLKVHIPNLPLQLDIAFGLPHEHRQPHHLYAIPQLPPLLPRQHHQQRQHVILLQPLHKGIFVFGRDRHQQSHHHNIHDHVEDVLAMAEEVGLGQISDYSGLGGMWYMSRRMVRDREYSRNRIVGLFRCYWFKTPRIIMRRESRSWEIMNRRYFGLVRNRTSQYSFYIMTRERL